ncbi:MAG: GNAT family N-acetyltransferase [Agriterribacter sp.]
MSVNLVHAKIENKALIENFMQFYMYDFSEFMSLDIQPDGLFKPYTYLDEYWNDANRFPYIIEQHGTAVGFVFVRWTGEFFSIAEFFVHKKWRRAGVGTAAARKAFAMHTGHWEVFQLEGNKPAQLFWQKVIAAHTNGKFSNDLEAGKWVQRFESR